MLDIRKAINYFPQKSSIYDGASFVKMVISLAV